MNSLAVLIADDEPPARRRLEELLARTPGCHLSAAVGDGVDALEAIRDRAPDILFLDIRMPGLDGLELARRLEESSAPEVVFVTAFGEHGPQAFDVGAADYLVKPFEDERFWQALDRCRARIRARRAERPAGTTTLRRLALEDRGRTVLVPLEDVLWIEADGSYVRVRTAERTYLARERLRLLDRRLPVQEFCRIHRSYIVRLDRIEALEARGRGDGAVVLAEGVRLPVSRTRRDELDRRLGTA